MNLYSTHGKGRALGSRCVICAKDELRAKQLHYLETGFIAERVQVLDQNMEITVNGKTVTEYCFLTWDGDY